MSYTSIKDIDLRPPPGKKYWSCERDFLDDFIYFIMVDRFHDDLKRLPVSTTSKSKGSGTSEQLKQFCGGTIKGIRDNLDYIQGLGCTALWLSPVFENNADAYHGYAIQNYLNIDPHFGTKQDLDDLVKTAHERNMRVFLDIVLNHSGDNWYYVDGPKDYNNDQQYEFGGWHEGRQPLPIELQDPALYHRRGAIRNWENPDEIKRGDFFDLKDFNNDDDNPDGLRLQEILIQVHSYWLRELDIDGFRLDAVKHMPAQAVARFCSRLHEYAYAIGKRDLFLFGEVVGTDIDIGNFMIAGVSFDRDTVYYGLDSALDFPLYFALPYIIKALEVPERLVKRYQSLIELNVRIGKHYLVTFIDNHDQVGQSHKFRFAAQAEGKQVMAGMGYLLCSVGTPCIYYGTEQGFSGEREDSDIREAMFDIANDGRNYHNPQCWIYQEIAKIAQLRHENRTLQAGRMYLRQISGNGSDFGFPRGIPCTLAFSRILAGEEILVAYNTSIDQARCDYVFVDSQLSRSRMQFLYGKSGWVEVQEHPKNGSRFVKLELEPMQFVLLSNNWATIPYATKP